MRWPQVVFRGFQVLGHLTKHDLLSVDAILDKSVAPDILLSASHSLVLPGLCRLLASFDSVSCFLLLVLLSDYSTCLDLSLLVLLVSTGQCVVFLSALAGVGRFLYRQGESTVSCRLGLSDVVWRSSWGPVLVPMATRVSHASLLGLGASVAGATYSAAQGVSDNYGITGYVLWGGGQLSIGVAAGRIGKNSPLKTVKVTNSANSPALGLGS